MAEAISVIRVRDRRTDKTLTFETGKLAGQADGAVTVAARRHRRPRHRHRRQARPVRAPTSSRSPSTSKSACTPPGKIPGSFFRREGKASDQAILTCRLIDRPLRPCFPDGFRNEVHVVGTILGADLVNPHDVLAINGASAALMLSGIPFDGPIGAVRVAFTTDGEWIPLPDLRGGRRRPPSRWSWPVACSTTTTSPSRWSRPAAPRPPGRAFEDGAPKVDEEVIAEGLEAAKTWIRESIEAPARAHRGRPAVASPPMAYSRARRLQRPRSTPRSSQAGTDRVAASQDDRRQGRAPAPPRPRPARPSSSPSCCPAFDDARRRREADQGGLPLAHQDDRAQAHRQRGRPHRRSWPDGHPAAVGRGRRAPDACTAPACSSGARPRCSTSPRSACPAWSRCSTRSASSTASATCTTTTSRRTPPVRPASCAARSAARSATACSPSGRSCRCCPPRRSSPTRSAPSPTCCRPTAPPRWARSAARPCR